MQKKKGLKKATSCCWAHALLALSVCVAALVGTQAFAQVIFQREALIIAPPPLTESSPKNAEETPPESEAEKPRTEQRFQVEVRGEDALNLEYIHTLNELTDDSGVMIGFAMPSIVSVPTMKVYQPVDVLFIDEDGVIEQILPNIVPAEITRDIAAPKPVSAFLYLKAGVAEKRGIKPRDEVRHSLFNSKPIIIK